MFVLYGSYNCCKDCYRRFLIHLQIYYSLYDENFKNICLGWTKTSCYHIWMKSHGWGLKLIFSCGFKVYTLQTKLSNCFSICVLALLKKYYISIIDVLSDIKLLDKKKQRFVNYVKHVTNSPNQSQFDFYILNPLLCFSDDFAIKGFVLFHKYGCVSISIFKSDKTGAAWNILIEASADTCQGRRQGEEANRQLPQKIFKLFLFFIMFFLSNSVGKGSSMTPGSLVNSPCTMFVFFEIMAALWTILCWNITN